MAIRDRGKIKWLQAFMQPEHTKMQRDKLSGKQGQFSISTSRKSLTYALNTQWNINTTSG